MIFQLVMEMQLYDVNKNITFYEIILKNCTREAVIAL